MKWRSHVRRPVCRKRNNSRTALRILLIFCTMTENNVIGKSAKRDFEKSYCSRESRGNPIIRVFWGFWCFSFKLLQGFANYLYLGRGFLCSWCLLVSRPLRLLCTSTLMLYTGWETLTPHLMHRKIVSLPCSSMSLKVSKWLVASAFSDSLIWHLGVETPH